MFFVFIDFARLQKQFSMNVPPSPNGCSMDAERVLNGCFLYHEHPFITLSCLFPIAQRPVAACCVLSPLTPIQSLAPLSRLHSHDVAQNRKVVLESSYCTSLPSA